MMQIQPKDYPKMSPWVFNQLRHAVVSGAHHVDLNNANLQLQRDEMQYIAKFLMDYPQITSLNLSNNNLQDKDVQPLANLTHIRQLDVSNNYIGNEGMAHIAKMTGLISLDAGKNSLDGAGVAHLVSLPALRKLQLPNNGIGDDGAVHLINNKSLVKVDIDFTHIASLGKRSIAERIIANRSKLGITDDANMYVNALIATPGTGIGGGVSASAKESLAVGLF